MTTEDDFNTMLDTCSDCDDWHTLLVFADWLQEQDDPRAEGYQALAKLKRWPVVTSDVWAYWMNGGDRLKLDDPLLIPADWFALLAVEQKGYLFAPEADTMTDRQLDDTVLKSHRRYSRRSLCDAAAVAFAALPEERKQELLTLAEKA